MRINLIFAVLVCWLLLGITNVYANSSPLKALYIQDGIVFFTLQEEKENQLPECVQEDVSQFWTFSLESAGGKAQYSSLIIALQNGYSATIVSANDCALAPGYERLNRVEIHYQYSQVTQW
ncbi:hypothetical protein OE749_05055 [Aestuariibacter sp. AA17]|uniref:Secreted protein n=1 Tax=Fluctibacter corallii TaxID=2984329 RepID=A0ABT3A644_9ALTE|nr:hypothetical protein [Aestuariibacter sp. AA17]MCV2884057.1 hypothetical protein [Aestuariibacter sp. AA17]